MAKINLENRIKELEAENKRITNAPELEKLRSKAYGTMINIAESTFDIPLKNLFSSLRCPF